MEGQHIDNRDTINTEYYTVLENYQFQNLVGSVYDLINPWDATYFSQIIIFKSINHVYPFLSHSRQTLFPVSLLMFRVLTLVFF